MVTVARPYLVYGLERSYFTRKMTGYLDYKGIPWRWRRAAMMNPRLHAAGWTGGMPAIECPDGQFMWDTTAMILHLEERFPERSVLPADPVQRMLCWLIEDMSDEWLYRVAVGSRWHYPENSLAGGFELARDFTHEAPATADEAHRFLGAYVRSGCPGLGVTAFTIGAWVEEVLRPWTRVLAAHFEHHPFLFGNRPSLADFAIFGGSMAHFATDPVCRRWADADAPAYIKHQQRLLEIDACESGDWLEPGDMPETLLAIAGDAARLYLPWLVAATGTNAAQAEVRFASGTSAAITVTPFLREAQALLLGRYVALRSPAVDAILEQAGVLRFFAGQTHQGRPAPSPSEPPRPALNQPYPPGAF